MSTINRKWIEREDIGDCAVFTALASVVLLSLEFLFTSFFVHYISIPIIAAEAAAAVVIGALIAIITIRATDDED